MRFVLFDSLTGECPTPTELLRDIEQLPDDEVLQLLDQASKLQADLAHAIGILKAQMVSRMTINEATLLETPGFSVKLEKNVTYQYNIPQLLGLRSHLTGEAFDKAIKVDYKPNKTELNKLVKLGGPVKAIIEAAVTPVEGPPSLKIQPKAV